MGDRLQSRKTYKKPTARLWPVRICVVSLLFAILLFVLQHFYALNFYVVTGSSRDVLKFQIGVGQTVFVLSPGLRSSVAASDPVLWNNFQQRSFDFGEWIVPVDRIERATTTDKFGGLSNPYGLLWRPPSDRFFFRAGSFPDRRPPGNIQAGCPSWCFLVVTAVLPSFVLLLSRLPRIWRNGASSARGVHCCDNCGYDCRTTPEFCPECGKGRSAGCDDRVLTVVP